MHTKACGAGLVWECITQTLMYSPIRTALHCCGQALEPARCDMHGVLVWAAACHNILGQTHCNNDCYIYNITDSGAYYYDDGHSPYQCDGYETSCRQSYPWWLLWQTMLPLQYQGSTMHACYKGLLTSFGTLRLWTMCLRHAGQ